MKKQFTIYFFITTSIFINFFILGGKVYAGETYSYLMPDKPIIESFCDDKGNCACSSFAEPNFSCSASSNTTVHVGETLNFTITVSGEETSGVFAFILPQGYDWVKEGGIKPWGTDLTYTKTFSTEDISARYFMYAYIKSSNDNYHRRSSGCNWTSYSCDDNAQIIYTVLPSTASLPTCIAFNYSDWSTCQSNGVQNRTVVSSSPISCSGGNPALTQSCTYTQPNCTSWTYSDWGTCLNSQQTRTITSSQPTNCTGGNSILSQNCTVQYPVCTSWTYSNWSDCINGKQTRTTISSLPNNCIDGNPIIEQTCQIEIETNNTEVANNGNQETGNTNTDSPINKNNFSSQKAVAEEKSLITKIDKKLSKRVKGNILLQVEKKGEGWYVNPDNEKKYYLGRPSDAFSVMRNLGLGIKHSELENYLNSKFPSRLSGKILLDVEQHGEAYYVNPKNLKGYFLNRPADAFKVMRELGLGITNSDIRKIDIGEIE
ncbi:MAG: hypothetical protein ABIC82_02390 [bacterium]